MSYAVESICFTIKPRSALCEAVADYGAHCGGYCKLRELLIAALVCKIQDKLLYCMKLQLQPMGRAHKNAP